METWARRAAAILVLANGACVGLADSGTDHSSTTVTVGPTAGSSTASVGGGSVGTGGNSSSDGGAGTTAAGTGGAGGSMGTGGVGECSGSGGDEGFGGGCTVGDTAFTSFHACNVNNLVDLTCQSEVDVHFGHNGSTFYYTPRCIKISAGATVNFIPDENSSFQIHPLQGGANLQPNVNSPIEFFNEADATCRSYDFPDPGNYPYYCVAHPGQMKGAIYVAGP